MTPKVPEEYFKFRKDEILTAAWKCFAEKGFQGTTMRDIAKKLDLSTGVIYNYYKNKDEVLDALFELILKSEDQIFSLMAQKDSASQAITILFDTCFKDCTQDEVRESAKSNIHLWTEVINRKELQKKILAQHNRQVQNIAKFIEQGIKDGEIRPHVDPETTAKFYQALITGIQLQTVLVEDLDLQSYYQEIKKLLFQNMWQ
jgi:AcrR family transcriptional regulator